VVNKTVNVVTQGLDEGVSRGTGEYETLERGAMDYRRLLLLLQKAARLQPPGRPEADECPPHVLVEGPGGVFSFTAPKGSFYNQETDSSLTAEAAADLAFRSPEEDSWGEDWDRPLERPTEYETMMARVSDRERARVWKRLAAAAVFLVLAAGLATVFGDWGGDSHGATPFIMIAVLGLVFWIVYSRFFGESGSAEEAGAAEYARMMGHDFGERLRPDE
jgi:hypothetical protein